jgi:hypothetical protein
MKKKGEKYKKLFNTGYQKPHKVQVLQLQLILTHKTLHKKRICDIQVLEK